MNETKQGSEPVKELKYSWKGVQGKHTHTEILWFIDGNNSLRKKPSTTSVSSDHTGSEHTGHIHSNQPLGMCNIWFGISVNKQIVVLWFQRGFTIWLVLWMSASGRRTETSWLVDLCKMAVLWLFSERLWCCSVHRAAGCFSSCCKQSCYRVPCLTNLLAFGEMSFL